jgi:hypothetical protein
VSRGQASERAVFVCEEVSVEKGAHRPLLPDVIVCPLPPSRQHVLIAVALAVLCVYYTMYMGMCGVLLE